MYCICIYKEGLERGVFGGENLKDDGVEEVVVEVLEVVRMSVLVEGVQEEGVQEDGVGESVDGLVVEQVLAEIGQHAAVVLIKHDVLGSDAAPTLAFVACRAWLVVVVAAPLAFVAGPRSASNQVAIAVVAVLVHQPRRASKQFAVLGLGLSTRRHQLFPERVVLLLVGPGFTPVTVLL